MSLCELKDLSYLRIEAAWLCRGAAARGAGVQEEVCGSVCAGGGVQPCGGVAAAVQLLPSPRLGPRAAGGRHRSPCPARRAGSGRGAG